MTSQSGTGKRPGRTGGSRPAKKKDHSVLLLTIAGLLAVVLLAWLAVRGTRPDFSQGLSYLKSRDETDVTQVASAIQEQKKQKLFDSIRSGERSVLAAFSNSVILGDSRAQGFSDYGYLSDAQTLTSIGGKVYEIPSYRDAIAQMQPDVIYVSYGVNDISSNVGQAAGEDGFGSVLAEQLRQIQEASPSSRIAVNSIIDIADSAQEGLLSHESVAAYNEEIRKMCKDNGWIYVDNSSLDPGEEYASDGVHFDSSYYPVWAANMFYAVMNESGES